jgi:pimeloyl-ACP methyl ester carboxylesterase
MLTETLINVGGYRLALYCSGQGTPSVILDAGAGAAASSWEKVHAAVAPIARVCAFDRPGIGKSDPAPDPRSDRQILDEVHTLLVRAAIPGPYVLVGHSSGGLNMRRYARHYPDKVAGLVLVDAVHPEQFVRAEALLPAEVPDEDAALHEFREALRTINRPRVDAAQHGTTDDLQLDVGGAGSLGAIPVVVLTATQHDLGVPAAVGARLEQDWQAMQYDLRDLSSNSVQIIAQGSGHNIQLERPELVADAIQRVIEAVRRHSTLNAAM